MVNTTYKSIEDMTNKFQSLKGKTKLKFYKNLSNYYDGMNNRNFEFEEDLFFENVRGISRIYHDVLLFVNFLQTKPEIKNLNNKYYDLFYTVNESRDEKEIVDDQWENIENDCFLVIS